MKAVIYIDWPRNVGICILLYVVLHIWYNNKCGYTWKQGRSVQEQDRPMSQGPGYRCDMQNVWRSQRSRRVLEMKAAEDLRREILVTRSLHHFSMLLVRPFLIMTNINSTNGKTLEHLWKLYFWNLSCDNGTSVWLGGPGSSARCFTQVLHIMNMQFLYRTLCAVWTTYDLSSVTVHMTHALLFTGQPLMCFVLLLS